MNVIEKKTRLSCIQDDIGHVDSKIAVIEIEGKVTGPDADRLLSASWHLQRAIRILDGVSFGNNPEDLVKILEISIGETRARRTCEFTGAENNNAG